MRPTLATLRLPSLRHNLGVVRRHAPNSRVWSVVKADAYGHGLLRVLPALGAIAPVGPDGLAILELDAARRLRDAGLAKPLLMLEGFFGEAELETFSRLQLTSVVHALDQVRMLELAKLDAPIDVYLKVNTGMNRLGLAIAHVAPALARLRACRNVGSITLMTHFADADGPTGVASQWARVKIMAGREAAGLPMSLANSAAILRFPETHADWVRPGIMVYGCTPFADEPQSTAESFDLQPVMTLTSEIIALQHLRRGDRVGYGGLFTAKDDMRIGVIACGYADGYPRHAPGGTERGTPVLVDGRRTRTVGRVSMDMICADLTALPESGVGSKVTLWGEGLSADEVAGVAGTVSYELLCALTPRVAVRVIE